MMRLTLIPLMAVALGSAPVLAGPELTKAYILSIIRDAKPDIDECGQALRGDVVKTHFTIDSSGEVTNVKIDGKHGKDGVGSCMRAKLASLRFGPSLKSTPVTMPFRFGGSDAPTPPPATEKPERNVKAGDRLDRKEVADLLKVLQSNMAVCGKGVVDAKFNILPNGVVRNVQTEGDDTVSKCVSMKLSKARFPSAKAATPVHHEFSLD